MRMRMWQWKWNVGDNDCGGGVRGGVRARRERAAKHSGRFCCWAAVLIVVVVVGLVEN